MSGSAAPPIALPDTVALFPLSGAVMLPGAAMPLNIFEPRYLAMVRDALADNRMIGIIQPRSEEEGGEGPPVLYPVGGLGRITEFTETPDGRYLIVLSGLIRFRLVEELEADTPYRQARVDYAAYLADVRDPVPLPPGRREEVEESMKAFLDLHGLSADWEAVRQADEDALVRTLAAVCPFEPIEKQALLEAADLPARAEILIALMRFSPVLAESSSSRLQ